MTSRGSRGSPSARPGCSVGSDSTRPKIAQRHPFGTPRFSCPPAAMRRTNLTWENIQKWQSNLGGSGHVWTCLDHLIKLIMQNSDNSSKWTAYLAQGWLAKLVLAVNLRKSGGQHPTLLSLWGKNNPKNLGVKSGVQSFSLNYWFDRRLSTEIEPQSQTKPGGIIPLSAPK